jgi:rod shape-determining protein MreD
MIPGAAVPRIEGIAVIVPVLASLFLALLTVLPVPIPGYAAVTPVFVLIGVYHWTIYRPELMPPIAIFALGLLVDLLTGAHHTGVTPLLLLLGRALLINGRRWFFGRVFPFVWMGFALMAAGTIGLLWGLNSALDRTVFDASASAFRWVLTVAAFPAASYVLTRLQRLIVSAG